MVAPGHEPVSRAMMLNTLFRTFWGISCVTCQFNGLNCLLMATYDYHTWYYHCHGYFYSIVWLLLGRERRTLRCTLFLTGDKINAFGIQPWPRQGTRQLQKWVKGKRDLKWLTQTSLNQWNANHFKLNLTLGLNRNGNLSGSASVYNSRCLELKSPMGASSSISYFNS